VPSEAFQQGQADRKIWEAWINGQSGDTRAGADYWASHRNTPKPGTCNVADNPGVSPEWGAGCAGARQQLAAIDVRRKAEPDYRRGFNAEPVKVALEQKSAAPVPTASSPATPPPNQPKPSTHQKFDGDVPHINIGERAITTKGGIACPSENDERKFIDDVFKSSRAKDDAGIREAISDALISHNCRAMDAGEVGLLVESSGIIQPLYRIRLDSNSIAYWMSAYKLASIE